MLQITILAQSVNFPGQWSWFRYDFFENIGKLCIRQNDVTRTRLNSRLYLLKRYLIRYVYNTLTLRISIYRIKGKCFELLLIASFYIYFTCGHRKVVFISVTARTRESISFLRPFAVRSFQILCLFWVNNRANVYT